MSDPVEYLLLKAHGSLGGPKGESRILPDPDSIDRFPEIDQTFQNIKPAIARMIEEHHSVNDILIYFSCIVTSFIGVVQKEMYPDAKPEQLLDVPEVVNTFLRSDINADSYFEDKKDV